MKRGLGQSPISNGYKKTRENALNFSVLLIILLIVILSQDITGTIPDKPE